MNNHYRLCYEILIYYRLCDKINHEDMIEVTVFFYNLAVNFANVVQYNKVNRAFEVNMLQMYHDLWPIAFGSFYFKRLMQNA